MTGPTRQLLSGLAVLALLGLAIVVWNRNVTCEAISSPSPNPPTA